MGALTENQFREPPLTYLNSLFSPAAFTRDRLFGAFKLQPDDLPELNLPLSVISLPFHHTAAFWTYCSLYHEVGHPLDKDLGLRGALTPLVTAGLADHQQVWTNWLGEVITDLFGILLGGVAYARSLVQLLFLPATQVTAPNLNDPHPTPYVRIFLVGALLRQANVPNGAAAAARLEQEWVQIYGGAPALQPLIDDCPTVARIVLEEPLAPALNGHPLRKFAALGTGEVAMITALARFLRTGLLRPDPANPPFPYRLVPAAAQEALQAVADGNAGKPDEIHERALTFIKAIPRPEFLAPPAGEIGPLGFPAEREAHLRGLVRQLDFRSLS
jgi:hypothetical protein